MSKKVSVPRHPSGNQSRELPESVHSQSTLEKYTRYLTPPTFEAKMDMSESVDTDPKFLRIYTYEKTLGLSTIKFINIYNLSTEKS